MLSANPSRVICVVRGPLEKVRAIGRGSFRRDPLSSQSQGWGSRLEFACNLIIKIRIHETRAEIHK